jgi:hypothetical protein
MLSYCNIIHPASQEGEDISFFRKKKKKVVAIIVNGPYIATVSILHGQHFI